jgi:hypothetical protein
VPKAASAKKFPGGRTIIVWLHNTNNPLPLDLIDWLDAMKLTHAGQSTFMLELDQEQGLLNHPADLATHPHEPLHA